MIHSTKIAQMAQLHWTDWAARALDKKCRQTTSTEPLVQIQNYFTELFLTKPLLKTAQMVLLRWTKGPPEL